MATPEDVARDLAVKVALREQTVDNRLNAHEMRLNSINGTQTEMLRVQKTVQEAIARLEGKVDTAAEVAKAVADKGVSTRSFYLGLGGLAIALGGLLAGTGHV